MSTSNINYYSLICSKDKEYKPTTIHLFNYLSDVGVQVKSLVGKNSIFEAYQEGFNKINCNPDDVVILCHDDIEILIPKSSFISTINKCHTLPDCGFIGVAGTRVLEQPCIWWDWNKKENLSGGIFHGTTMSRYWTQFGNLGQVVVLDGVFLACKASVLKSILLQSPQEFSGRWDFYDIYYTFQAHLNNFKNYTIPLTLRHESSGNPRESWDANRRAFIEMYKDKLPTKV
jgi:hypothetical protein